MKPRKVPSAKTFTHDQRHAELEIAMVILPRIAPAVNHMIKRASIAATLGQDFDSEDLYMRFVRELNQVLHDSYDDGVAVEPPASVRRIDALIARILADSAELGYRLATPSSRPDS